jgi:trimeric autotransporter adhesin
MHWKPSSWMLIGILLAAFTMNAAAQIATTQVTDTIYHADGTPAAGTVLISWPAFTTGTGESVPSGSTAVTIAAGGALTVQLIPNAGSTPIGSYYTAVYHLDDGSVSRQYWVVPASAAPVKISAIESTVLPTSVAMQTVSKAYVDTAIAAATSGHPLDSTPYVLKSGDTMTGPLTLPADPVSATQAADKNYVDESIAAATGGLGQKVSVSPSATQIVAQPAGTQLDVNNLNGVLYASQYVTGRGNNGISNAAASTDCAGGCEIVAEPDYTTELYSTAALNSQTHVRDSRGGRQVDSYKDPLDVVNHGYSTAQTIDDVSTQSEASLFQQNGNEEPGAMGVVISQEGLAGGSNLFPEEIESRVPYFKMAYSALTVNGTYNTQGQHVLVPQNINCYGVGDCLMGSRFLVASGGFRDSADEGAHPFDLQSHEDTRVFTGICSSGCTAGSTTVMTTPTAGTGTQGDGRFLIDTNATKTITSSGTGGSLVGGSATGPHASAQFRSTNFPVSVFLSLGQAIPSQTNNLAPGTVTFSIAASGVPTGYATNTAAIGASSGLACVIDQTAGYAPDNYEMAPYTVIDATHLQMTFNKPHQVMASLAFGGLCGYGLEQTVDTASGIRQLFPVLGAISATSLYYAGGSTPIAGAMNQTSGFLNVTAPIASLARAGGVVSVTTAGNMAANINGLAVTIAGVADSSYNGNYVVTTTGTNSFSYSQPGANSTSGGGTASILTGGFALYPMAEVLSVFDEATKSVDGQFTLAPNSVAWAPGDPVEEPHFYQEAVSADTEYVGQFVPRPTVTIRAGLQYQQNNGPGLIGWSIANAAPLTNYLGYGGTHGFPNAAYEATGIWLRSMNLTAGEQAVFGIHCNLHGCGSWNSGYDLFELDSSVGVDTMAYAPTTSTLNVTMRGTGYSFTPQAFTAGTINVGALNATTINGVNVTGPRVTTVTVQHTFTGAGTFNYTHNLGTSYPLMTCYVNSGSPAYTAGNVDANNIAITVTAASDITCTFGN